MAKLNVLVSLITEDNDYQKEQAAAAEDAARLLDANLQIVYADNDAVNQSQQLVRVIQRPAQRPDEFWWNQWAPECPKGLLPPPQRTLSNPSSYPTIEQLSAHKS